MNPATPMNPATRMNPAAPMAKTEPAAAGKNLLWAAGFLWIAQLTLGFAAASPLRAIDTTGLDQELFAPGGFYLLEVLRLRIHEIQSASLRSILVFFAAQLLLLPAWQVLFREAARTALGVPRATRTLPRFVVLSFANWVLDGAFLLVLLAVVWQVAGAVEAYRIELALGISLIFLTLKAAFGSFLDLARAGLFLQGDEQPSLRLALGRAAEFFSARPLASTLTRAGLGLVALALPFVGLSLFARADGAVLTGGALVLCQALHLGCIWLRGLWIRVFARIR